MTEARTVPGFTFTGSDSFEKNWKAFLKVMESVDADMAAILIANKDKLAAIVSQGTRNSQARAEFNAAVLKALDALLVANAGGKK
jgi:hypothetical protein